MVAGLILHRRVRTVHLRRRCLWAMRPPRLFLTPMSKPARLVRKFLPIQWLQKLIWKRLPIKHLKVVPGAIDTLNNRVLPAVGFRANGIRGRLL